MRARNVRSFYVLLFPPTASLWMDDILIFLICSPHPPKPFDSTAALRNRQIFSAFAHCQHIRTTFLHGKCVIEMLFLPISLSIIEWRLISAQNIRWCMLNDKRRNIGIVTHQRNHVFFAEWRNALLHFSQRCWQHPHKLPREQMITSKHRFTAETQKPIGTELIHCV